MLTLKDDERAILEGTAGPAAAMAMRILVGTADMLGADRLIPIASVHVDGCLYHGDSGTHFAERLVKEGGAVRVPTTLNVGALDLIHPSRVTLDRQRYDMARRMMMAYQSLGCQPTWTCAPYQAGHRPQRGQDVAWGESNAIVFCNSVLGARTDRYGDFLDICAALTGRAPYTGFHKPENRRARVLIDAGAINPDLLAEDAFYPVLGAWLGHTFGDAVAAIDGLPRDISEDRLKALGAAAASSGAIGLFHIVGVTPEAPTRDAALGGRAPEQAIKLTAAMLRGARDRLSTGTTVAGAAIDAVAIGSPHLSAEELARTLDLLAGRRVAIPFYACTGRHALEIMERNGKAKALADAGVTVVADTCVVVTPILKPGGGLLMTNSGKFAHYAPNNIGCDVVYGSLTDCVES
ncbi:MAG: DUF521 domain-containing protein, partial [Alphaproteobacteria bacterium]|nr:DUF521 domain-containing protein [Alphaproteobacteria bacterium]